VFSVTTLLERPPTIRIVDVGAMSLGEDRDPYANLMRAVPCEVIGFEPVAAECEKLNRSARPGCRYLPHVIGDGSAQTFYECNFPMTSSLLEPDMELLGMFHGLAELTRVIDRRPVQTVRLDDIAETRGADYLKMDVQGGELMVLEGATERLRELLVVHTEVEFQPMYKGQPLFADIDSHLRGRGFVLHRLASLRSATFKLPGVEVELPATVNQALWGDAVYVREFRAFDRLSAVSLLKIAVILHENYESTDLAALALHAHDRAAGTDLSDRYLELLFQG
jgi:FkbM family methyltransferase